MMGDTIGARVLEHVDAALGAARVRARGRAGLEPLVLVLMGRSPERRLAGNLALAGAAGAMLRRDLGTLQRGLEVELVLDAPRAGELCISLGDGVELWRAAVVAGESVRALLVVDERWATVDELCVILGKDAARYALEIEDPPTHRATQRAGSPSQSSR